MSIAWPLKSASIYQVNKTIRTTWSLQQLLDLAASLPSQSNAIKSSIINFLTSIILYCPRQVEEVKEGQRHVASQKIFMQIEVDSEWWRNKWPNPNY